MSNWAVLHMVKVVEYRPGHKSYFEPRCFDDEITCPLYNYDVEANEKKVKRWAQKKNHIRFLKFILEDNQSIDELTTLMQDIWDYKRGLCIFGHWHDFSEIQSTIAEFLGEDLNKGRYEFKRIRRG